MSSIQKILAGMHKHVPKHLQRTNRGRAALTVITILATAAYTGIELNKLANNIRAARTAGKDVTELRAEVSELKKATTRNQKEHEVEQYAKDILEGKGLPCLGEEIQKAENQKLRNASR